jgi:hypothetical protein
VVGLKLVWDSKTCKAKSYSLGRISQDLKRIKTDTPEQSLFLAKLHRAQNGCRKREAKTELVRGYIALIVLFPCVLMQHH